MFKKIQKDTASDLGFGSVVTERSNRRFVNRNGTFNVDRKGLNFFTSLSVYHRLLSMTWWQFILVASGGYFLLNLLFAFAYVLFGSEALQGPADATLAGQLLRAFFFSIQTSSTIGYGHITPGSIGANVLVAFESFIGLLGLALATGMVFARFSRPTAKILFSKNAIVAPYKDITGFMFRIVNARQNQILELDAQVHFSFIDEKSGKRKRSFHKLALERSRVPFFPLSWTIVHPIDKDSPLYHMSHEDMQRVDAEFMILLTGLDDTFNQTVYSRSSYKAQEVVYEVKFANIYENLEDDEGPITINISKLSDIERV